MSPRTTKSVSISASPSPFWDIVNDVDPTWIALEAVRALKAGLESVPNSWSKPVILSATVLDSSVPPIDIVFALTSNLPNEPVLVPEPLREVDVIWNTFPPADKSTWSFWNLTYVLESPLW